MRQDFINALESIGIKNYKLIYTEKGMYGEPEAWLYPKNNPKQQKINSKGNYVIYADGSPVMESISGLLIEKDALKDLKSLKQYIAWCMPKVLK